MKIETCFVYAKDENHYLQLKVTYQKNKHVKVCLSPGMFSSPRKERRVRRVFIAPSYNGIRELIVYLRGGKRYGVISITEMTDSILKTICLQNNSCIPRYSFIKF